MLCISRWLIVTHKERCSPIRTENHNYYGGRDSKLDQWMLENVGAIVGLFFHASRKIGFVASVRLVILVDLRLVLAIELPHGLSGLLASNAAHVYIYSITVLLAYRRELYRPIRFFNQTANKNT